MHEVLGFLRGLELGGIPESEFKEYFDEQHERRTDELYLQQKMLKSFIM